MTATTKDKEIINTRYPNIVTTISIILLTKVFCFLPSSVAIKKGANNTVIGHLTVNPIKDCAPSLAEARE